MILGSCYAKVAELLSIACRGKRSALFPRSFRFSSFFLQSLSHHYFHSLLSSYSECVKLKAIEELIAHHIATCQSNRFIPSTSSYWSKSESSKGKSKSATTDTLYSVGAYHQTARQGNFQELCLKYKIETSFFFGSAFRFSSWTSAGQARIC
jgi:hypothetical protein